jgi:two-component system alkaline phosphatase synthesis response regulator PhoP
MPIKAKQKILIIDDEPDLLETVCSSLEENGYSVTTASNGEEGFKKAGEERPELILLDIMMPKMDGYELLDKFKRTRGLWDIPVVMVTAKSESRSILRSQELRASDYLIKPFDANKLLSMVRRYI